MSEEIEQLKRRGRKVLIRMLAAEDGADCGHQLLRHISPNYDRDCQEFEVIMARLNVLDPRSPK